MEQLKTVSGVSDFLDSHKYQLGKEIMVTRIGLNLRHSDLVEIINSKGFSISCDTLSKIEIGHNSVDLKDYTNVHFCLNDYICNHFV